MARIITRLGSVPCTINPPIITLSPVCTKERVEMLPSRAIGVGVGVGVGVAVGVTVAVGVGVAVAIAVGVGVGVRVTVGVVVGVAVGVAVAVAVDVGVGVGVGVDAPDCTQYLPPVLNRLKSSDPPQMTISLPVQMEVCKDRLAGALVVLVASQASVPGAYLPPVLK
jgi:hypothetical protein